MKAWKCYLFATSFVVLLVGLFLSNDIIGDFILPNFPNITVPDNWGGRDNNITDISDIRIKVPDSTLIYLSERIKTRNVAPSMPNSNFINGFNGDYLHNLMKYWATDYRWRHWEDVINKFPHRFTNINGLQIHFIHIKPKLESGQVSIPILLLHGWPGSFFEFYKLIPLLTDSLAKESFAFEIVCPSLVGYGWSDRSMKPGFGLIEMSDTMFKLMNRVNITRKFYVQGGDWGGLIAGTMARMYPKQIAGIHINIVDLPIHDLRYLTKVFIGSFLPTQFHFLDEEDINMVYPFKQKMEVLVNQMGYFWLQTTRPATIGIALSDSPAGLAAYILEKFGSWSHNITYHLNDPYGGLETMKITMDEMLTNVMIYYITNSISSSMMLYKEAVVEKNMILMRHPIRVPVGIASFPNELFLVPKVLAQILYRDIRQFTRMPRGGHFAALEEPELLALDLLSFVKLVENQ